MDAALHLMAKHRWRVLEPFHFLNPLGYCNMNRRANALLLVASVSSKAIFSNAQSYARKRKPFIPLNRRLQNSHHVLEGPSVPVNFAATSFFTICWFFQGVHEHTQVLGFHLCYFLPYHPEKK